MADIKPLNAKNRLDSVLCDISHRHPEVRWPTFGKADHVLAWRPRLRKAFLLWFPIAMVTTVTGVGFVGGPVPAFVWGCVASLVTALTVEDSGIFGHGLPRIHNHFFRLNHRRANELIEKCRTFDAMVESLPSVLKTVSNREALLATQQQRRAALEAEVQEYLRDIELIDGIYWLDKNENLRLDIDAYGFTGDVTALVSLVQAREELSENFPLALQSDLQKA